MRWRVVSGFVLAISLIGLQARSAGAAERLGTVSFPVSCSPAVQADFNRGVALLHDFWYEEARPQFARILKVDPGCAMAHWGLAMSGFHQIWDIPDAAGMQDGWRKLQPAQATPAKTPRERAYIAALSAFFQPGKDAFQPRIDAYAAAMGKLYANFPDDVDAGAFYALALLAAHSPTDESLSQERKALAVLNPLWIRYPDHPGLVHYIIHACDSPALAAQGLAAARRYGALAASGPHAVHMPGHIFARLGLWQEDIKANADSVAASHAADEHHQNGWMDQFHSDDFLAYAYLQSGQEARAKAVVDESEAAIKHYEAMPGMADDTFMSFVFANFHVRLPVFYALETRDWQAVGKLQPMKGAPAGTQTIVYWARVIADGHLHQPQRARADLAAREALIEEMKKQDPNYSANSAGARISRGEMLAWVAYAQGKIDESVTAMRASADLQDKVGQGEVDIPAREMLADILLESGKPAAALVEYRQALRVSPNRFNGLYGAGHAAEAAGDAAAASDYYTALLKQTDNGVHSARPELVHAKAYLAAHPARG